MVEGHECRIDWLHVRVVVSRHVDERNAEARDEVLEIVEGQVAARHDEVRAQRLELVSV
jgi:hypothetical protein